MKITAVNVFYNDSPFLLERALKSIRNHVDYILAIDGVYREFPINGSKPWSTDGCLEIAKQYADRVIEAKVPWYDQVAKRNAYFRLESEDDWYFIIDSDEEFEGKLPRDNLDKNIYNIPLKTFKENMNPMISKGARFIKHINGIRYAYKHAFIWHKESIINRDEFNINNIGELDTCCINHYPDERPQKWLECDGEYIRNRDENKVNVPNPVIEARAKFDLVRLKFIGKHYDGYDPVLHEFIAPKPGQFVFCSREKANQLNNDFPTEWKYFGKLDKKEVQVGHNNS